MVPRCKDQYYRTDMLFVAQAVHSFLVHWPVSRFSSEHSIQILRNRGTLSLWFQQASILLIWKKVIHACTHKQSLYTVQRYVTNRVDNTGMSITYEFLGQLVLNGYLAYFCYFCFVITSMIILTTVSLQCLLFSLQWLWLCLVTMSRTSLHLFGTCFFEQILLASAWQINLPSHPLTL